VGELKEAMAKGDKEAAELKRLRDTEYDRAFQKVRWPEALVKAGIHEGGGGGGDDDDRVVLVRVSEIEGEKRLSCVGRALHVYVVVAGQGQGGDAVQGAGQGEERLEVVVVVRMMRMMIMIIMMARARTTGPTKD
jgi:hypothetical protein